MATAVEKTMAKLSIQDLNLDGHRVRLAQAGAGVRHILNIRFAFAAWRPVLAATIGASVIVIFTLRNFGVFSSSFSGRQATT